MDVSSDRIALRRFSTSDGAALHAYLSLPEVVRFEPYEPMSLAQCETLAIERSADNRFWAVCLKDGLLIGNLFLAPEGPAEWRTWTLGYVMHSAYWGNGYATEAALALLDHCFNDLEAHRVIAGCDPANVSSWRLMERLGMRREAHLLGNVSFSRNPDGEPVWTDSYQYAVLDTEWPPSSGRSRSILGAS